jgi:hypothetical protein
MPLLNWSPGALAALPYREQREAMTRLFDAYFRVSEGRDLTGAVLHLDLPAESKLDYYFQPLHGGVTLPSVRLKSSIPPAQPDQNRHYFFARFTKNSGWVVYAKLKPEYRVVSKEVDRKFGIFAGL